MRKAVLLSDAFRGQVIFLKIYVASIMAGEKSGGLVEVLERYISYQKRALAVRKKILVDVGTSGTICCTAGSCGH